MASCDGVLMVPGRRSRLLAIQNADIAVPTYDPGQAVVDQMVADPPVVAWQVSLAGRASGRVVWSTPLDLAPTLVAGGQLIGCSYSDADKGLVSLDACTRKQRWRRDNVWPSPELSAVN